MKEVAVYAFQARPVRRSMRPAPRHALCQKVLEVVHPDVEEAQDTHGPAIVNRKGRGKMQQGLQSSDCPLTPSISPPPNN
jgi:hypothetical protein